MHRQIRGPLRRRYSHPLQRACKPGTCRQYPTTGRARGRRATRDRGRIARPSHRLPQGVPRPGDLSSRTRRADHRRRRSCLGQCVEFSSDDATRQTASGGKLRQGHSRRRARGGRRSARPAATRRRTLKRTESPYRRRFRNRRVDAPGPEGAPLGERLVGWVGIREIGPSPERKTRMVHGRPRVQREEATGGRPQGRTVSRWDDARRHPRSRGTSRQYGFRTDHAVGRTPRRRRSGIVPGLREDNRSPVALSLGASRAPRTTDSIDDAGLKRHGTARRSAATLGTKEPSGPGDGLPGRQWTTKDRVETH